VVKYLVTGGAGFIGSHLVDALLGQGHDVAVLDDMSSGKIENLVLHLHATGSVTNPEDVCSAMHDCNGVFHLAAIPLVAQSVLDPISVHDVNTYGTLVVLNEALQRDIPVVFASSSAVYGNQSYGSDTLIDEGIVPMPVSPYAATKLAGEAYCEAFVQTYGMSITALRFFNVYGPRQGVDSAYGGAISSFCDAIANERTPIIYGDGHQERDFVFVGDVVRALILAMRHVAPNFSAMNLGSGETVSILQVLKRLTDAPPEFRDARPGDVRYSRADITQAARALGFSPEVDLADGLNQTLQWFEENK
jgi:UDP-glucose 4-epimerase